MAQTQKVELKDVNKTLGRMDLMSIAVGQIIGAGVMTMSIKALGMTGRAVNIAFVIAAVSTLRKTSRSLSLFQQLQLHSCTACWQQLSAAYCLLTKFLQPATWHQSQPLSFRNHCITSL